MDREKFIEEFKKEEINTDIDWQAETIKRSIKSNLLMEILEGIKILLL